jgi:DNA (cytosine-5)-methyltransferase 1
MNKKIAAKKPIPSHRDINPQPRTFIDIFAGCGGLSLGLMQSGWQGLFALEHESNAFLTLHENLISVNARYKFNWPDWLPKTPLSVTSVTRKYKKQLKTLVGNVDMVVGGPPCQGFSDAGRRSASDPRNQLVEAYLKFVNLLKPRIVLMENVRGITSDFEDPTHLEGKINYADKIISTLSKKYTVFSRMIDTSLFGVPQRRSRFFIIAIRKEKEAHIEENPFEIIEQLRYDFLLQKGIAIVPISSKDAISDLETVRNGVTPSNETHGFSEIKYLSPITPFQRIMNRENHKPLTDLRLARHKPHIKNRFQKIIDICHSSGRLNISLSPEIRASLGIKKSAIRVLDPDKPSPTITSMPDDLIHYSEPRTLTVRENARLQGFPDWFVFKGHYTTGGKRRQTEIPRFTQVANAVPPLVAEAIGKALAHQFTTTHLEAVKKH